MPNKIKKIFIHGWATNNTVWNELIKNFKDASAVNLPSHGSKSKWTEPTLKEASEEILENLKDEKEVIGIGWSLGAQALIRAALDEPEKFKTLVLIGATPCFTTSKDFSFGQPRTLVRRMIKDFRASPAQTLMRFYRLNFTERELQSKEAENFLSRFKETARVLGTPSNFDFQGIETALSALMQIDLRGELGKIKPPTLIIHGTEDKVCPVEAGLFLSENIQGSIFKEFKGAGHAPFITEREKFRDTINDFLDKQINYED